jgi:hypothetical protein
MGAALAATVALGARTGATLGAGSALGGGALGAGWARSDDVAIVSDIVAIASDTTTLFRACIAPC